MAHGCQKIEVLPSAGLPYRLPHGLAQAKNLAIWTTLLNHVSHETLFSVATCASNTSTSMSDASALVPHHADIAWVARLRTSHVADCPSVADSQQQSGDRRCKAAEAADARPIKSFQNSWNELVALETCTRKRVGKLQDPSF